MSKSILITGCSTGFGFDAAKYLAGKGHHVYATMRGVDGKNTEAASNLRDYALSENINLEVIELDVTSDDSVNAAVSQISQVDVLINNAGLGYGGPLESLTSEQFSEQLDVNIVGTFRTIKAVLPKMRAQKSGLIIQVSSIAGRISGPAFGVYQASKWGLEAYSEALRYEVSVHGIDVVIVQPGPFSTNFLGNVVPPKDEEIADAYKHVVEYGDGFGATMQGMYADDTMPTDPQIVVDIFEDLINAAPGTRPMRTVAGLDFGVSAINDAIEPFRKGFLEQMQIDTWDGPQ